MAKNEFVTSEIARLMGSKESIALNLDRDEEDFYKTISLAKEKLLNLISEEQSYSDAGELTVERIASIKETHTKLSKIIFKAQSDYLGYSMGEYTRGNKQNNMKFFKSLLKLHFMSRDGGEDLTEKSCLRSFLKWFVDRSSASTPVHYYSFKKLLSIKKKNEHSFDWLDHQVSIHVDAHTKVGLEYKFCKVDEGEVFLCA